jgi:hypothetical protein
MKSRLDRIISIATLVASLTAIFLVLKKPAPVTHAPAATAAQKQSLDTKTVAPAMTESGASKDGSSAGGVTSAKSATALQNQTQTAQAAAGAKPEAQVNSDTISGMVAKLLGGGAADLTPDSNLGSGEPNIKDQQITMDGDIVHGKFLTEIGGKNVWVTISGRMGEKDGYATFDPTEFKVGDTEVPVSVVNPLLQKKLAEERDRLKIPNNAQ